MKHGVIFFATLLFLVLTFLVRAQDNIFPDLKGPYLGQAPPELTPKIFAPGIVSKDGDQGEINIAPDMDEIIYWERKPPEYLNTFIRFFHENNQWYGPEVLTFSTEYVCMEPSLSPDGKTLFYVTNRPKQEGGEPEKKPDIWLVKKTEGKWGRPTNMGSPINSDDVEVQPFMSAENRFYFCRPPAVIYFSNLANGQWQEPVKLSKNINSGRVSSPRVSPDMTCLIFHSNRADGVGGYDLYISFKDQFGAWMESENIGAAINTTRDECDPSFSPDGKYIFFSRDGDIYWVKATVIDEFRP